MKNNDFFIVLHACADTETAELPGTALVEESHVARLNVVPGLRSIHRWNGAAHFDEKDEQDEQVVALPVADGHHAHLEWVSNSTRTPQS